MVMPSYIYSHAIIYMTIISVAYMPDDATEVVAEHSSRLQPSINYISQLIHARQIENKRMQFQSAIFLSL